MSHVGLCGYEVHLFYGWEQTWRMAHQKFDPWSPGGRSKGGRGDAWSSWATTKSSARFQICKKNDQIGEAVMVRSPGYFDKNYYRQFRMGWWYLIFGQLMNKLCRAESGKIGFHHHGKCREHHIFLLVNSVCGVVSIWFPILFTAPAIFVGAQDNKFWIDGFCKSALRNCAGTKLHDFLPATRYRLHRLVLGLVGRFQRSFLWYDPFHSSWGANKFKPFSSFFQVDWMNI